MCGRIGVGAGGLAGSVVLVRSDLLTRTRLLARSVRVPGTLRVLGIVRVAGSARVAGGTCLLRVRPGVIGPSAGSCCSGSCRSASSCCGSGSDSSRAGAVLSGVVLALIRLRPILLGLTVRGLALRLIRLDVLPIRLRLIAEIALGTLVPWIARLTALPLAARLVRRVLLTVRLIRRRLLGASPLVGWLARLSVVPFAGISALLPTGLEGGRLLGGGAASVRGSVHRVLRLSRRNVGASLGRCDRWTDACRAVGLGREGARNLGSGPAVATGRWAATSPGGGTAALIPRRTRCLFIRSGAAGHLIRILRVGVLVHRSSFRVSAVVSPLSEMGRSMRNVAPPPGVSWTEIAPWWFSTIALTIDSPSPDPPVSLVRDTSRR